MINSSGLKSVRFVLRDRFSWNSGVNHWKIFHSTVILSSTSLPRKIPSGSVKVTLDEASKRRRNKTMKNKRKHKKTLERTEVAEGCFIVSSSGKSLSGTSTSETVAEIVDSVMKRASTNV